jgi:protein-tyrosine phosphatase
MNLIKTLFVCTGNTCRSPFAAVALTDFIKKHYPQQEDYFLVRSAGICAREDRPASTLALEIACEYHLDLSMHKSTTLTASSVHASHVILTMTQEHLNCLKNQFFAPSDKTFLMSQWLDGKEILDPFSGNEDTYTQVFEHILLCIPSIAKYLLRLAETQK